jgi:hypothetical protein
MILRSSSHLITSALDLVRTVAGSVEEVDGTTQEHVSHVEMLHLAIFINNGKSEQTRRGGKELIRRIEPKIVPVCPSGANFERFCGGLQSSCPIFRYEA